jgi:MHS family alpha-ketoglutarate permease-like MFS transporter
MLLMAISSFVLALLPTYEQFGALASAALLIVRLLQGLAHGGESGVSYTYMAEIAPAEKRGLWSSFVYVGVTLGVMAATALGALLTSILPGEGMQEWGWRIGFALGGVLGLFALWMRRRAVETEAFEAQKREEETSSAMTEVAPKLTRKDVVRIALRIVSISVGLNVCYYTWITFMPSVAISQHGMDASGAFTMSLTAQAIALVLIPLFGGLSDRIGRKPIVFAHGLSIVLFAIPIAMILGSAPWTLFVAQMMGIVSYALMASIYAAVVSEQAPTRVRAMTVGVVTSLSVAIFGGTGPYLNTWLQSIGYGWMFNVYIMVLGCVVIIGSALIRESKGVSLADAERRALGTAEVEPTLDEGESVAVK